MNHHQLPVLGQPDIRLNPIDAGSHRVTERRHGIFGIVNRVAAMSGHSILKK